MFRGLYTATSGMMAHHRKQQILTNNLANANTPGFKQDQTVLRAFPAQLIQAVQMGPSVSGARIPTGQKFIGTMNTGVYAQEGIPSFLQGPLKETRNTTDFALLDELLPINPETQEKGTMVFAVAFDNNQIRYTKNGQFTINREGFLTTSEGYQVLNQDLQPIQVNSKDFKVLDNGRIDLANGFGNNDRLWIGYTEESAQFSKEGHGLLRWSGNPDAGPQFVDNVERLNNAASFVKQGFIEQSNVDVTHTMTEMITTYRGFESNQKVIQAYDRSMEKTVNDIGRI